MFDDDRDDRFDDQEFCLDLDSNYYDHLCDPPEPPELPTQSIPPDLPYSPVLAEREPFQPLPGPSTIVSFPAPSRSGPTFPTIAGLLPRASINLVAGSSFSGRTRFLLPQFDHYAAGLPFLGRPVPNPPEQLGMIVCGRGGEDVKARIEQLGLKYLTDQTFPVARWIGRIRDESEYSPTFPLEKCYSDLTDAAGGRAPHFLLIDNIQKLAPVNKITEYTPVCEFYDAMREWCKSHDCTVLGTVVKAKAKVGAGYESIVDQIYGGVMWADNCVCIIGIDRYSPTSTIRKITILSKASYGEVPPLWVNFNEFGHLELVSPPEESRQTLASSHLTAAILDSRIIPGAEHTRAEFVEMGKGEGVSSKTVDRWLAECVEDGKLVKRGATSNLVYWKPLAN